MTRLTVGNQGSAGYAHHCLQHSSNAAWRRSGAVPRHSWQHRATGDTQSAPDVDDIPPGCARYTVKLKKPLGMVLESDKKGKIWVAELKPDGAAAKTGQIRKGDQLIATSGIVYNKLSDYSGVQVRSQEQTIRVLAATEEFDVVMAAIASHPGHVPVTLEFQQCDLPQ